MKISLPEKIGVTVDASKVFCVMLSMSIDTLPVELLNGNYVDWIDDSSLREEFADRLSSAGLTLKQFKDYAKVGIRHKLFEIHSQSLACPAGPEYAFLKIPDKFNERVHRFLNPGEAKPKRKKKQAQHGLFV
jgi:hypothetical protein